MSNRIGGMITLLLVVGFCALLAGDIFLLVFMMIKGSPMSVVYFLFLLIGLGVAFNAITSKGPRVMRENAAALPDAPAIPAGAPASDILLIGNLAGPTAASCAGWLNALESMAGPVATEESLSGAAGKRLVVIPANAVAPLIGDAAAVEQLNTLAAAGCAVIIENPDSTTAAALGLPSVAGAVSASISWIDGDLLPAPLRDTLTAMPLPLTMSQLERVPDNWAVMLRAGGHPAALCRAVGRGGFIVLLFEYNELSIQLRQGRNDAESGLGLTAATPFLRVLPALKENDVPYADALDIFLMTLARRLVPLCAWAAHPGAATCTLILTANDDYAGERTNVITELLRETGAAATLFLLPDSNTTSGHAAEGAHTGLLWNRYHTHSYRGGLRDNPHNTLADQVQAVALKTAGEHKPDIARIHQLRLDGGLEADFDLMAAAGIQADASFGPGPGRQGYVFATGYPFRVVAGSGRLLDVIEMPFQIHDLSGAPGREWLDGLIEQAAQNHHSPITLMLHPHTMLQNPRVREAFKYLLRAARDAGLVPSDAGAWLDFRLARTRSAITSRFEGNTLIVTAEARGAGLALDIPDTWRGLRRAAVRRNAQDVPDDAFRGRLLPLESGSHSIEVQYGN